MGCRKHKACVRWRRRWRNVNKYLSSNRATPLNGSTWLRKVCLKSTFWEAHWGWCRLNKQDRGNVTGGHRDKSRRNQGQDQSQTLSRTRPKSVKTAFFILFWSVLSADLKFSCVFLSFFYLYEKPTAHMALFTSLFIHLKHFTLVLQQIKAGLFPLHSSMSKMLIRTQNRLTKLTICFHVTQ